MPDDLATRSVTGSDTLRRGVRVLGRGMRDEPGMFALAVAGSAVYGLGVAGSGWLLGRLTQSVLAPAFAAGAITAGQLAYVTGTLALVALVTSIGVVGRRAAGGAVTYRLQARYRRAVTRQYLRLPLAWHHRHPAGQLLSNANADVEATWQVFSPLPMALGVVVMLVVAACRDGRGRPAARRASACSCCRPCSPRTSCSSAGCRRGSSSRSSCARACRRWRTRASRAPSSSRPWAGRAPRPPGSARSPTSCATRTSRVGITRGLFDPIIEALPVLGTLAVLVVGTARVAAGEATTGDVVQVAYLLTLLAVPGARDRLGARRAAAGGRRLRPGRPRSSPRAAR